MVVYLNARRLVRTAAALGLVALALGVAGASPMQSHGEQPGRNAANWSPVDNMHLYLCAFHIAKENPGFQVQAHHYCSAQGKSLHQCVVYDSRGSNARLLGVEYIVPDEVYQGLSGEEKKYWHPHAYEIIAGQLVAPDMPDLGDDAFRGFITSWGKTWHTWRDPATELPVGEPLLMWSANGDGQINARLMKERDEDLGISTAAIRERRKAYGFGVPDVPPPRSLKEPGRRWTPSGPDQPARPVKE